MSMKTSHFAIALMPQKAIQEEIDQSIRNGGRDLTVFQIDPMRELNQRRKAKQERGRHKNSLRDDKRRQLLRRSGGDRRLDDIVEDVDPLLKVTFDEPLQPSVICNRFPYKDAAEVRACFRHRDEAADDDTKFVDRLQVLQFIEIERKSRIEIVHEIGQRILPKLLFRSEVIVNNGLGKAGGGSNVACRDPVKAVSCKLLNGGL